jgi:hypothetical protein
MMMIIAVIFFDDTWGIEPTYLLTRGMSFTDCHLEGGRKSSKGIG